MGILKYGKFNDVNVNGSNFKIKLHNFGGVLGSDKFNDFITNGCKVYIQGQNQRQRVR